MSRSAAGRAAKPAGAASQPTEDAAERVLADLSRAYGLRMNRQSADEELHELASVVDGSPHSRWSYSAEQRAALRQWGRVRNRRGRGAPDAELAAAGPAHETW